MLPIEAVGPYTRAITFNLMPDAYELYEDYYLMMNWEPFLARLKELYPEQTNPRDARILTVDYGTAAAIDFFGEDYGLPRAISGHMSYYYWPPEEGTPPLLLTLGDFREELDEIYKEITLAGYVKHHHWMEEKQITRADEVRPFLFQADLFIKRFINNAADRELIVSRIESTRGNVIHFNKELDSDIRRQIVEKLNFSMAHIPVYICRKPRGELARRWLSLRLFGF